MAELSEKICEEHRLSVIKNPQDKTVSYDKWLGNNAKTSGRDWLRMTIDAALRMQPDGFDALMQLLEDAGCWIKRGAQISIKPPNGKRYVRLDTLGAEYTEAALRSALRTRFHQAPNSKQSPHLNEPISTCLCQDRLRAKYLLQGYLQEVLRATARA